MPVAILTVGPPGSGKTTWAREQRLFPNVCRDDIRAAQGLKHGEDEKLVTEIHRAMIAGLAKSEWPFIIADTNVNRRNRENLIKYLEELGVSVVLMVFDTPLQQCLEWNAAREARVPDDVVKNMYNSLVAQNLESGLLETVQFTEIEHIDGLPKAILVDIDGTVAYNDGHRGWYEYDKVANDLPHEDILRLVHALSKDNFIIYLSGRSEDCRVQTTDWLVRQGAPMSGILLMRPSGDHRPDWIVKNELIDEHVIGKYNIEFALDDRDQVVRHFRNRGIRVLQVADGNF